MRTCQEMRGINRPRGLYVLAALRSSGICEVIQELPVGHQTLLGRGKYSASAALPDRVQAVDGHPRRSPEMRKQVPGEGSEEEDQSLGDECCTGACVGQTSERLEVTKARRWVADRFCFSFPGGTLELLWAIDFTIHSDAYVCRWTADS